MKTILIPTDFSPGAENALMYAMEMNKKVDAKIVLFHSYFTPVYTTDIPIAITNNEELKLETKKSLEELLEKLKFSYPDGCSKIELSMAEGAPDDEILDYVDKNNIDMVVMGTRGASGLKEVLFGTNTASVIDKIGCPLIAVPFEAKFKGMKKIVFATNYAENDRENIEAVIDVARLFDSELIILHISSGNHSKEDEEKSIQNLKQRIIEDSGYDNVKITVYEDKEVEGGVIKYLEKMNADLVAMTSRYRNVFQKLFDRSLTKKMINHTHIPLMAYHVKERGGYFI